ncbi:MAG TPA: YsnF/AvaK domain-containing protein [Candidatus Angelobacter sp.]|nr:YsnF/AvaK domain-containing protein [Candidatus Angelobacter sp.]
MAYEKIVAVYDRSVKAKDAMRALEAAGFSTGDMSLLNRDALTNTEVNDAGLWRRLFGRDVGDHQSASYSRAIETGGAVLTLRLPESDVPRAMKILDVHPPTNVNETSGSWEAASTPSSKAVVPPPVTPRMAGTTATTTGKEEVLRLAEEHLDVGKRQVEKGRARVRRFVIEEPVESQVTLHEEHASLLRRPVTDSRAIKDVDWADKTIEITETEEQAVVNKTAHIAEEVVVRREGSDHVETVRDKIRRQQVEIERLPRDSRKVA